MAPALKRIAAMVVVVLVVAAVTSAFKPLAPRRQQPRRPVSIQYRIGDSELDVIKTQIMKTPELYRKSWWRDSEEVAKEKSLMSVETAVGRAAMLVFTVLMANEFLTGESFLEQLLMDMGLHL